MSRADLLAMLERDEGRRKFVYDDATGEPIKKGSVVKGNPTIGIGCELSMTGLTDEEIDYLAENRIGRAEADLDRRWPWWRDLSEARQEVLVSMVFQMGAGGVARFPKFLAALQRGDYAEAATEALDSKWAREDSPGRAQRLAEMVRKG